MGIEITSGGVSKTYRFYPSDTFYVDASGNVNTNGNGQQVKEAYFNGVKYYPSGKSDLSGAVQICQWRDDDTPFMEEDVICYPYVTSCVYEQTESPAVCIYDGGLPTELVLPACTIVGDEAFFNTYGCDKFDLPVCTSVGERAFEYCYLKSINLPECLSVGSSAFTGCENLTGISLPKVGTVEYSTFSYCHSLARVDLPLCTKVEDSAFLECTSLTSVSLPVCVKVTGEALAYCSALTSVSLPVCENVGHFYDCMSLTSVNLPACKYIGDFDGCTSLRSVNLPLCAEGIDEYRFRGCTSLTTVSMPKCSRIYDYAFDDCQSLSSLTVKSGCRIDSDSGIPSTCHITYV